MHEVVCAGMLVADVFANPVSRLPNAGELVVTPGFLMSVGGGPANTAAALSILGRKVAVAGKLGNDIFGHFVVSELDRYGVDVEHIRRTTQRATSCTVIMNVHGEDRRYLHSIGANADFSPADMDITLLDGARCLYVGGYLAMPCFTPDDLTWLFRQAKLRGLMTVLDVVMASDASFEIDHVAEALKYADYFLPNEEEARLLTGQPTARGQAEAFSSLNPNCTVVITLGRQGSLAMRRNDVIETRPFPMHTVDESGAGDAFAAGLITGLLNGWELEYSLSFASAVGASRTRALGCFEGVFTFDEAVAFLEARQAACSS